MNENTDRAGQKRVIIGIFGRSGVYLQSPLVNAWWSAAFPGLGQFLLNNHIRGSILFLWEIFINTRMHLNIAIIYTFAGQFDKALDILDPRWTLLYIPFYFYTIWDSYRTTIDLNRRYLLLKHEPLNLPRLHLTPFEINYLDKRIPTVAVLWSLCLPGLGQLYLRRISIAFFLMFWSVFVIYNANILPSLHLVFLGRLQEATEVLNAGWFMFLPSIFGFSMYDAYLNTVIDNKFYMQQQRELLKHAYQSGKFTMPVKQVK
ncbi:MAG TPA: hypothetical protein VFK44_11285 [Bacillales bacterium]|nr:hypothetical protein [Bacillales bacterium]